MQRTIPGNQEAMALIQRVNPKFRPVWDKLNPQDQVALARYFLRWGSQAEVLTPERPGVVSWYCPFACQSKFSSGHRYCINVYAGCAHRCCYCYVNYGPEVEHVKEHFRRMIDKDMADLERFDVPPAPVHLSNSTDACQSLEGNNGHTRYTLEQIRAHRKRFTTVTLLTKNPAQLAGRQYLELLKALGNLPADHPKYTEFNVKNLPGLVVEISLIFWRDGARAFYEPGAPSVESRIESLHLLHEAGIPLVLRIDPLFPRAPLPNGRSLSDFGLPDVHTLDDLEHLVELAATIKARHVVYSPVKIVMPRRGTLTEPMQAFRRVFETMVMPEKLVLRGKAWRLPAHVANEQIVDPFLAMCRKRNVAAKYCKQSLIETP